MSAAQKLPENPLLNKDLIQAFITGVTDTISTMANTKIVVGKPSIQKAHAIKGDVMGIIGMVAPPLKGKLIISFPKVAILHIMNKMLGENYTEMGPEVTDAVGELTNMIYGSAKTTLNSLGYKFEMAIPTVIQGNLSVVESHPSLLIPFTSDEKFQFFIEMTVN